ncbi:hypothetical protein WJ21_18565 [Burkholderia vietnamiensis]|nr:hypothetical protein WJ21_18565 [Burkholderia vietnamiensis]
MTDSDDFDIKARCVVYGILTDSDNASNTKPFKECSIQVIDLGKFAGGEFSICERIFLLVRMEGEYIPKQRWNI